MRYTHPGPMLAMLCLLGACQSPQILPSTPREIGAQLARSDAITESFLAEAGKHGLRINQAAGEKAYQRVQKLFTELRPHSPSRALPVRVVLLAGGAPGTTRPDAYTNGGTYLFLMAPLVNRLTDDELAFIIAHELSHIAADTGFIPATGRVNYEREEECMDRYAMEMVTLAGYDRGAGCRLLEKMGDKDWVVDRERLELCVAFMKDGRRAAPVEACPL